MGRIKTGMIHVFRGDFGSPVKYIYVFIWNTHMNVYISMCKYVSGYVKTCTYLHVWNEIIKKDWKTGNLSIFNIIQSSFSLRVPKIKYEIFILFFFLQYIMYINILLISKYTFFKYKYDKSLNIQVNSKGKFKFTRDMKI